MPPLTLWFIRTSLVYFTLALLTGILLAVQAVNGLFPVYLHLLVFGWLTQLVFGIAFWMFPKYSMERPHRSETMGWAVYVCLNLGLILRAVAEPVSANYPEEIIWGWILIVSAVLQWLAGMMFVINTWARVRGR